MSPNNNRKKVSHKLEDVAQRELGVQLNKEHQASNWGGELSPDMLLYAGQDSRVLLHLVEALGPKIREADLHKVVDIECRAMPAITWMANAGVPFDSEGWRSCLDGKEAALGRLRANHRARRRAGTAAAGDERGRGDRVRGGAALLPAARHRRTADGGHRRPGRSCRAGSRAGRGLRLRLAARGGRSIIRAGYPHAVRAQTPGLCRFCQLSHPWPKFRSRCRLPRRCTAGSPNPAPLRRSLHCRIMHQASLDTIAEAAVFPIGGFDELNVEEISKRLDNLSIEVLHLV
jgi:hypothetical protein